ncbi:helix-turn-helix domain-containing protein [Hymenobacter sp. HMF4947]|uniref:Helix-turn-helix domain-containing protein n=1 Tax=Hymenobacter ginkgonis TaxID=2682976 RepID=A0A7K1TK52_9BACT|nr:AraC family transcriptional regulator [Hymenobacter ginkgonis]MVN78706.1 helix-turn-helix domain-containing protein [Hymenobacter ginkgonis]
MKPATLPVLPLAAFPAPATAASAARHPYYVQQLAAHVAQFPGVSAPHAHDFYLLLYITRGSGTHTIDLQAYELRPGALFFLAPGQVHGWELSADAAGYIVFFEAEFYQRHYPAGRLLSYPFFDPSHLPVCYLPAPGNAIEPLLGQLWQEARPPAAPPSDEVVAAYLFLVLELAARCYPATMAPAAALGRQQVREFSRLLNQHFRQEKTVAFYADKLNVSPNHLTAICQRVVGHPARDLIVARVMADAQRRLRHSADSVAQVAAALGYDDTSYFSRAFKKHVGLTPEAFRKQR